MSNVKIKDTEEAIPNDSLQNETNGWEISLDHQQPESPGTRKLQQLATFQSPDDQTEVSAKFVERPLSSGSVDFRNCAYGPAPKRNIQIPRKSATEIYGAPKKDLCPDAGRGWIKRDGPASGRQNGQRTLEETADSHGNLTVNSETPASGPTEQSTAPHIDDRVKVIAQKNNVAASHLSSSDGWAPERVSLSEASEKAGIEAVEVAPLSGQEESPFIIAPPSRTRSTEDHSHRGQPGPLSPICQNLAHDIRAAITNADTFKPDLQNRSNGIVQRMADPTISGSHGAQEGTVPPVTMEDNSSTTLEPWTDNRWSPISDKRQPSLPTASNRPPSIGASSASGVTTDGKILKHRPVSHKQQRCSAEFSRLSMATAPSEEDLYFLLLHRLRQREHTDKQLHVRLRQLECEKSRLFDETKGYVQQIENFRTAGTRQTTEIRNQKAIIDDMKNRYLKIKDFMKQMHEDREILKSNFDTVKDDQKMLQHERRSLQQSIEDAQDATQYSTGIVTRFKGSLKGVQEETSVLGSTLHNAEFQLRKEHQLLAQERRRNLKLESHITDITRRQHSFSVTVQKEQQHLVNALSSINRKLSNLQGNQPIGGFPANLHVLDQCVGMLKMLTQVENATSADVNHVIQVVGGLSQSITVLQKESQDSCQKVTNVTAEAGHALLTQITEHLTTFVTEPKDKEVLAQLREAKNAMEERLKENEIVLLEVKNDKVAAERRETDLRNGNAKLLEELTVLRETALTPKKGSAAMTELQNLLIKWTSANSLLAESLQRIEIKDQKIQTQEDQIRQLSNESREAQIEKEGLAKDNRTRFERLSKHSNSTSVEASQTLVKEAQSNSQLQRDPAAFISPEAMQARELEDLKSAHDCLLRQANETEDKLSRAEQTSASSEANIEIMKRDLVQMDCLRIENERLSVLAEDSELKDGEIAVLNRDLKTLRITKQEIESYKAEVERKTSESVQLTEQLQDAQKALGQLSALQHEIDTVKEENLRLKHAEARSPPRENEQSQKKDQVRELDIQVVKLEETMAELDRSRTELSCLRDEYGVEQKRFEAAQGATTRIPILEHEMAAKDDEVSKLKVNLAEAAEISRSVPDMQRKMYEFSESVISLQTELEIARRAVDELQSVREAKSALEEQLQKRQESHSTERRTTSCGKILEECLQRENAQDSRFQDSLKGPHPEPQKPQAAVESGPDHFSDDVFRQANNHTSENDLGQEQTVPCHDIYELASESIPSAAQGSTSGHHRKRAIRGGSNVAANASAACDQVPVENTAEVPGTGLSRVTRGESDESNDAGDQSADDTNIVPESQPCAVDQRKPPSHDESDVFHTGCSMSSSPLSDIGDLFNSPEKRQPSSAGRLERVGFERGIAFDTRPAGNRHSSLADGFQPEGYQELEFTQPEPHQVQRPPSSSYGESLLLDDLERVGSLRAADSLGIDSVDIAILKGHEQNPIPAKNESGKERRKNPQVKPGVMSISRREGNEDRLTGQARPQKARPSPRRLRSSETVPQKMTGSESDIPVNSRDNIGRQGTPSAPVRERHRPNSAIKRKSGVVATSEEAQPGEKKRAKRNLSNIEVIDRPAVRSQTLQSSSTERVGQGLSRLRQSSNSNTGNRTTIVGKNAPAPGAGKQGPRKAKGGSRSQKYHQRFGGR